LKRIIKPLFVPPLLGASTGKILRLEDYIMRKRKKHKKYTSSWKVLESVKDLLIGVSGVLCITFVVYLFVK